MNRPATLLPVIAAMTLAWPLTGVGDEEPDLKFSRAENALVVTTSVTIDDTPHVLWTHSVIHRNEIDMGPPVGVVGRIGPPEIELYYYIFQNRDDPALWDANKRTTKDIQLTWRLVGYERADETYHVKREFVPSAKELKELVPKLLELAEEGEKRLQSSEFIP